MHLAAARDIKRIGANLLDMQRHVLQQLALQAVAQIARRDILALTARERRIVDGERHLNRRIGNFDERQRLHFIGHADRAPDGDVRNAGERDDLTGRRLLNRAAAKAGVLVERDDLCLFLHRRVVVIADDDLLVLPHLAALDAADADTAHKLVVVDGGNQQLQIAVLIACGRVNVVDDRLKQRHEIRALLVRRIGRRALAGRAEDRRRLELFVRRIQVEQQLEHLIDDLMHTCVGPVDLVDDDDDLVPQLQRLLQHKPCLRHRAFGCVDQQQNAVDHFQDALHLAGKVGVARRVDDVDLVILVVNRRILGENGDAALALEIAGVHHALHHSLIFTIHAALLQHLVDQRRLAMVNVGNDGDIPNFILRHNGDAPFN